MLHQMGCRFEHAFGVTGWTYTPAFARIGDQKILTTLVTTGTSKSIGQNATFQKLPEIFNNDATLTSALLDRLLHHAETVLIEGKSYRMKDQIES